MDLKLAEKILKQFKELDDLRLFVSGEPLLHPRIVDLVRLGKMYSKTVTINTNCDALKMKLSRELCESGLDKLVFSYHYPYPLSNIESFLKINKGKVWTELLWIIPKPEELPTKEKVLSWFNGLSSVEVRRPHNWAKRRSIKGSDTGVSYNNGSCWFPNEFVTVLWDGRVVPCCNDLNGEWIIGDMKKDKLSVIEKRLDKICDRMMKKEIIPELCSGCERYI